MQHEQIRVKKGSQSTQPPHVKSVSAALNTNTHQSPIKQHYRNMGNEAVQRMMESETIQAKLKIDRVSRLTLNHPNDKYEQEADRVADQVMRMPEPKGSLAQRESTCPECKEDEAGIQTKPLSEQITPLVQRQIEPEEEEEEVELIQTKGEGGSSPEFTSNIESSVNSLKGGGEPLPQLTRLFFEPRFDHDFSKVRIHTDSNAAETARSINAKAFTTGKDVVFGSAQYSPETSTGKRLLAHELTHVVQQKERGILIQRKPDSELLKRTITEEYAQAYLGGEILENIEFLEKELGKSYLTDDMYHMIKENLDTLKEVALSRGEYWIVTERVRKENIGGKEEVEEVPAAKKNDDELVHGIIDNQLAILQGWETALTNFDKVLTSASDKSTKPNFKKVLISFLKDKLMSEMISRAKVTGAGDAFALLGKLEAEVERAKAAQESANLRDFFVQYNTAIGKLQQTVHSLRDDFLAKVRLTRERLTEEDEVSVREYDSMRKHLVELLEWLDDCLKISTPENLFMELSEAWLRQSTIPGSMGTSSPAFILIRIEEDFSIRDAEIKGPSGQKIAEQLLRDSPQGVDVFDMEVPRRILHYKRGEEYYSAIVRLDENGNLVNYGSLLEGNYLPIYRALVRNGLPPTKKLSGD